MGWIHHDVKKGAKKIRILLPDCANPMIVGGYVSVSSRRNTTTDGPKPNGTFFLHWQRGEEARGRRGGGLEVSKSQGTPK